MTVNDLIKMLTQLDREKQVVFTDGEQGLFVLTDASVWEEEDRVEVCISCYSDLDKDIP